MCFEWDERYYHEQVARLSKEKVDALIKRSQEAVSASLMNGTPESSMNQPADKQEEPATT